MKWSVTVGATIVTMLCYGLLSGCGGHGGSAFSCKGLPDGKNCASTRKNFERTNGSEPILPYTAKGEGSQRKGSRRRGDDPTPIAGSTAAMKSAARGSADDGVNVFVTDSVLPAYQRPYPVRTPAVVMRVWMAPYEDETGNLHDGRFVFREVQTRQWTIGSPATAEPPTFFPLQSDAAHQPDGLGVSAP